MKRAVEETPDADDLTKPSPRELARQRVQQLVEQLRANAAAARERGPVDVPASIRRAMQGERALTLEERLERAGVPPLYRGASLTEGLRPRQEGPARILRRLLDAGMALRDRKVPGCYLSGPHGVGKTWLMGACARYAMQYRGWTVRWVRVRDWLQRLEAVYQDRDSEVTVDELVEPLRAARLLCLDELPRQRVTPFVADTLEGVVDYRLAWERPFFVTCNLSRELVEGEARVDEIQRYYNAGLASRIWSLEHVPVGGDVDQRRASWTS